ncbi:winged helix-turn-helix transcriptional regulator [Streptomyces sp. AJS327]|uniref:winged helix-turn-helix transcriptional regulator n=1 Tax=Streptomyces sp. AJS327 TaxID=2545265 RepID=UPI0035B524AB
MPPIRARRRYDQFCPISRALDHIGDRWTLLIVRELLAGPRRYTDLHADLPGVSTDVLAARLKDMERAGVTVRRRAARTGPAHLYELTERGRALLPVLVALGEWGAPELAERRPTDAVRAHWLAIPLRGMLETVLGAELDRVAGAASESTAGAARVAGAAGTTGTGPAEPGETGAAGVEEGPWPRYSPQPGEYVVELRVPEGVCHVRLGPGGGPVYGEGPAERPDAGLELSAAVSAAVFAGELSLAEAVAEGAIRVHGAGPVARALRTGVRAPGGPDGSGEREGTAIAGA